MSGNPFLNIFLQALVEIPGFLLGRCVCNRFGRRWSQAGAYSMAAVFQIGCLITVIRKYSHYTARIARNWTSS
jgi:hypothetical protein